MRRKGSRPRSRNTRAGASGVPQTLARATQLHQSGRLEEAERLYREVLAAEPNQPDAMHLLGVLRHQIGDAEGAVPLLQQAVAARPGEASYHYNLAEAFRTAGRFPEAAESYRATVARAPTAADAHFGLGNALWEMDRLADAETAYRQAVRLAPRDAEAHNNLGNVLAARNKPDEAAESYRAALRAEPTYTDARCNLGRVLLDLDRAAEAQDILREGLAQQPDSVPLLLLAGRALGSKSRWAEAERHLRRALEADPKNAEALDALAGALLEIGRAEEAKACYLQMLDRSPDDAAAMAGLGACELQLGAFEPAASTFRRALALDGALESALIGLVGARQELSTAEFATLKALADDEAMAEDVRQRACFAVADVLDRRGDYDAAFAYYQAGNQIAKRHSRFDRRHWSGFIKALTSILGESYFGADITSGCDSDLPVFIVGMPRSGTTLVEQIVASHPAAAGAGELYEIQHMAQDLAARDSSGRPYPDCLTTLGRAEAAELARAYLARLRSVSETAARITDKMPGNFIHIGLIARLFPKARILHCRRDPMDACLSCYCQSFRALDFTADLEDLGEYYRGYRRLMDHWRALAPLPILDIRYEEVVADPEAGARRIIDFLGLEWDDRCLRFHETERQIRTASVWQARQPVYRSSVGRWRRYETHLDPLKKLVTESGA